MDIEKLIDERIKKLVPNILKSTAFTDRKLTDTPSDNLQVVSRKYVNMYSSVASLPVSSVIGQQVFVLELGYPAYKHQNGRWVNSVASIIA